MPSLRNEAAWLVEATPAQAAEVVGAVVAMTPASMGEEAVTTLAQMIIRRGYTAAELAFAMEELMYDPQLAKDLSFRDPKHILPADFQRIIGEHRKMRRQLGRLLSRYEMNKMIEEFPDLTRDDFGVAGYTSQNEALYRFKRDPSTPNGQPRPFLEDDERPGADRQRTEGEKTGPVSAGDAVKRALDDLESTE